MKDKLARRQFLKDAGASILLTAGMGLRGASAEQSELVPQPKAVSKTARLFPGCCAYTYRKDLLAGRMTLEDFIRKAVVLRLVSVDMTAYYLKSTDPSYLAGLRHLAYTNTVEFSGAACGASMVQPTPEKRADSLQQIKKWVDVTERLGASHLRIFAGPLPPGATLQQAVGWVVETMRTASDYSSKRGIKLGLEDHHGITQTANVCLEIMRRVNSPYAGINLDITNFIPTATEDEYDQIAACMPYATQTHIRDRFGYNQSPVDLEKVFKMFADAGFKGYMSFEGTASYASHEIPATIVEIQRLCKKYSTV